MSEKDPAKQKEIENTIRKLLELLGEDLEREGLRETPRRVAEALQELLEGYRAEVEPVLFHESASMVTIAGIPFTSLCEHHLLPFIGVAHVAYIPRGKVIGVSKVVRIVRKYAHRLQIQERLTRQIAEEVSKITNSEDVVVLTEAVHTCMVARGVRTVSPLVVVEARGAFNKSLELLNTFLKIIEPYRLRIPFFLST